MLRPCAAAGLEVDVVEEAGRAVGVGGEVAVSGTPVRPGGGGTCVSLTWISRPPSCLRCLCPLDRLVSPCTQARVSPLVLAVHRALYCRRPHFDRFSLSPCSVACRFHIRCWAYPPPGLVPFSLVVEASPLLPCYPCRSRRLVCRASRLLSWPLFRGRARFHHVRPARLRVGSALPRPCAPRRRPRGSCLVSWPRASLLAPRISAAPVSVARGFQRVPLHRRIRQRLVQSRHARGGPVP